MKTTKVNISKRRKIQLWIVLYRNNKYLYCEDITGYWDKKQYDRDNYMVDWGDDSHYHFPKN